MKKVKRIRALALSAVLLLALLAACNGDSGETKDVNLADFYRGLTEKYAVCETPEQAYPDDAVSETIFSTPSFGQRAFSNAVTPLKKSWMRECLSYSKAGE